MKPKIVDRKTFEFAAPDCDQAKITIALEEGSLVGFIESVSAGPYFVGAFLRFELKLRDSWEMCNLESVLQDIERYTRKGNDGISFATMPNAIKRLKIRDWFGIPADFTPSERKWLFGLWYSTKARQLTNRFQFPRLKNGVFRPVPPEQIFGRNKRKYN